MVFSETEPPFPLFLPKLQPLFGLTATAKANPEEARGPTLVT